MYEQWNKMETEALSAVAVVLLLLLIVSASAAAAAASLLNAWNGGELLFLVRAGEKRPPVAPVLEANLVKAYLLGGRRIYHEIAHNHKRYKTWRTFFLPFNYIFTADPVNTEYMLKTNFSNFRRATHFKDLFDGVLGDGIFFTDGERWREQRKAGVREISARAMKDSSIRVFQDAAVNLATLLMKECQSGPAVVNMQNLLRTSTMESFCKIGFGFELSLLPEIKLQPFVRAFDMTSSTVFWRHFDILWRLKRCVNKDAELKESVEILHQYVAGIIQIKRQQVQLNGDSGKKDFLSYFVNLLDTDSKFSQRYVEDILLNFVLAGRDTISVGLSWLFPLLCKHPRALAKIIQEIDRIVQPQPNMCESIEKSMIMFCQSLTRSTLENMHYLQAAISESLRLYPSVPMLPKDVISDDTLPDGFNVKKGEVMVISVFAMGRMPYIWGDDAEEFKPERWLNNNGVFMPQSPFKYLAFNAGPRTCLGKDFALTQMKILVALFVYFFQFQVVATREEEDAHYQGGITLLMKGDGLCLRITPRSTQI